MLVGEGEEETHVTLKILNAVEAQRRDTAVVVDSRRRIVLVRNAFHPRLKAEDPAGRVPGVGSVGARRVDDVGLGGLQAHVARMSAARSLSQAYVKGDLLSVAAVRLVDSRRVEEVVPGIRVREEGLSQELPVKPFTSTDSALPLGRLSTSREVGAALNHTCTALNKVFVLAQVAVDRVAAAEGGPGGGRLRQEGEGCCECEELHGGVENGG